MTSNLRWKLIAIFVVVALAVLAFYPTRDKVKLGLDLKGGVHLVLRVQTDDALKLETEMSGERLRDELSRQGIPVGAVTPQDARSFRVEGVPADRDADFRRVAEEWVGQVFDRSSSVGGTYTFTLKNVQITRLRQEAVAQALQTIERRVNELGVAEPIVAPHGEGDQILVQMPGVTDVARAKEIIRSTALLELKIVEDGPAASREALLAARGRAVPGDLEVVPGAAEAGGTGPVYYLVKRVAGITGRDLRNARPSLDENNQPAVGFSLNQQGAEKFSTLTSQNIGRQLAIILDGRIQSAPTIEGRIYDEGRISGSFTQQEVQDLSLTLRSGALPASLTYLEERTVGPSLGADSIRAGVMASAIGLALVTVFMLVVLQADGHQRGAVHLAEPADPARLHGLHRRRDDAAGHRRLHPHHRHGRGLERADLRAHQGGTRHGQVGPRGGVGRIRSRLPHHSRHARRVARSRRRSCSSSAPARFAASRRRCSSACCPTCSPRCSCPGRCSNSSCRVARRARR